jgi:hypothetical protein
MRIFLFNGKPIKILLLRLPKNRFRRGWWKMYRCKASDIPRNEAYREVRRSDLPC